jgi:hypothetical protein
MTKASKLAEMLARPALLYASSSLPKKRKLRCSSSNRLQNSKILGWRADVQKLLLLLLATRDLAGQDLSMDPCGDMGENEQQAENRRTTGWMKCHAETWGRASSRQKIEGRWDG